MGKGHTKAAAGATRASTRLVACTRVATAFMHIPLATHVNIGSGLRQLRELRTSAALRAGPWGFMACSAACAVLQC